jgi:N-acetylglucosamine-6-sulfatase
MQRSLPPQAPVERPPAHGRVRPWRGRLVVAFVLPLAFVLGVGPTREAASVVARPNVVILLSDDESKELYNYSPIVQDRIAGHGVFFDNAMIPNSLCCPSRTSILTGLYSHHTGVWDNGGPYGGFGAFDDASTLATWLHGAGYRTGLFGKYLNGYGPTTGGTYVPPGWDAWSAYTDVGYNDYALTDGSTVTHYSGGPYSTTLLADEAARFIDGADPAQPIFMYYAPFNPHKQSASPTAVPEFQSDVRELPPYRPPSFNETDVRDKPNYVRRKPLLDDAKIAAIDDERASMAGALQSFDRAVGTIVDELAATDRLSNTLIVFLSDNGYLYGEHRLRGKNNPYDMGIRVPMAIRYDGDAAISAGTVSDALALNIDLAPTIADYVGLAGSFDGRSLRPVLDGSTTPLRRTFVLEGPGGGRTPPWCGARTQDDMYVRYADGEAEYYDYSVDPYELKNAIDAKSKSVQRRVAHLRDYARTNCNPPYPGYSWSTP